MKLKLIVLVVALVVAGCSSKRVITDLPPGVTQSQVNTWLDASNNLLKAQQLTHSITTAMISLNRASVIPDGQGYGVALTAVGKATQLEIEAAQYLNTVPNSWSQPISARVAIYARQILEQLNAANQSGVLNVRDPVTGQQVTALVSNVIQVIQLIQNLSGPVVDSREEGVLWALQTQ